MATPAQIEANRRNAQHSTGPRSEQGKQIAARNATKLGLFSRHLLLAEEDPAELEALRVGMLARLKPADAIEHLYADRIICAAWRLRRALAGESDIYAGWLGGEGFDAGAVHANQEPLEELTRLQRHIASLERAMDKALAELHRLQKLRRDGTYEQEEQPEPPEHAALPPSDQRSVARQDANSEIEPNSPDPQEPGEVEAADEDQAASTSPIEFITPQPLAPQECEIEPNSPVPHSKLREPDDQSD